MTPHPPVPDPLSMPVGALAAHADPVQVGTSLRATAHAMAEAGLHAIAVADGQRLVGVVDEAALVQAMAQGLDANAPVDLVMDRDPVVVAPHVSGAEALRVFDDTGRHALVVADATGAPVGVITPSRLLKPPSAPRRPRTVGGLATPFGVYLTNGVATGGAKGLALVATGALMVGVFLAASFLVVAAAHLSDLNIGDEAVIKVMEGTVLALFLAGIRVLPISGTHGAEHMVVHAIERGEELTPEVVRRMPRVHPRCGTNIAVGAGIFLGLMQLEWPIPDDLRLIVAAVITISIWRPLGSVAQYFLTTKRPTDAQLASGIRAGRELLAAAAAAPRMAANPLQRIAASGLPQVVLGATVLQLLVFGVLELLPVPESWRVFF